MLNYFELRNILISMKNTGFTMIEMVIVIMIIGILSSILLPNFSSIQDSAKNNAIKQTIHTFQMAIESYNLSNGTYPSSAGTIDELVLVLKNNDAISTSPTNPFTGSSFSDSDPSGRITFTYNSTTDDYALEGFGRNNSNVLIHIGSE